MPRAHGFCYSDNLALPPVASCRERSWCPCMVMQASGHRPDACHAGIRVLWRLERHEGQRGGHCSAVPAGRWRILLGRRTRYMEVPRTDTMPGHLTSEALRPFNACQFLILSVSVSVRHLCPKYECKHKTHIGGLECKTLKTCHACGQCASII